MVVTLTKTQSRALNSLRGMPENAHMLVMCARITPTGGQLEGSKDALYELVDHIGLELAEGTLSATAQRALIPLCEKINPDCADWLGM